jgi:carboxylesterase
MVTRIYKKVKGVLFADPELLYKEERKLANKPFKFIGTNGKAVMLIHGWTSVPYEVRRLGKYLNENGYTVYGPMLSGHGTVPKDLEKVRWSDWMRDADKALKELKKDHEKVYIGGTSIGANVAMLLAENRPDISGLILMATPYKVRYEKLMTSLAKIARLFKKYNRKYYPPTFGVSTSITRIISYQSYPIESALETFSLIRRSRRNLKKITQPCFIIQSKSDHIVGRKSLERIYEKIGSKIKKKKYIKRAYHTFISDIKNEGVFEEILKFIEEN